MFQISEFKFLTAVICTKSNFDNRVIRQIPRRTESIDSSLLGRYNVWWVT